MFVVDTNILVYAANRDADEHGVCRKLLESWCRLPQDREFGESVFTQRRFSCMRKALGRESVGDFLTPPLIHRQQAPMPEVLPEEPDLDRFPEAWKTSWSRHRT